MIRNSGDCKNTSFWGVSAGGSGLSVQNKSISCNITIGSSTWGSLVNYSLKGVWLKSDRKYTLRFSIYSSVSQTISVMIGPDANGLSSGFSLYAGDQERQFTFNGKNVDAEYFRVFCTKTSRIMINWVKLEEGELATAWTPNPNDSIYSLDSDLIAALNGTTISGGLQLTTKIKLGLLSGGKWTEQGGISANIDNIMLWAGGTYDQAKSGIAKTILYHDGSGKFTGDLYSEGNNTTVKMVVDTEYNYGAGVYVDDRRIQNYIKRVNLTSDSLMFGIPTRLAGYRINSFEIHPIGTSDSTRGLYTISANWPSVSEARIGEVYRDTSGYLKVK